MTFAFLPADIVSQILNFGAPAPIDLQVRGADLNANFAYANKLLSRIRRIPGIADARIQQSPNAPTFNIDVDRTRAQYVGLTERDVTNSLVVNLAGSAQVAPTYYLNPDNGVSYSIVMQTPQYQIDSLSALQTLPITAAGSTARRRSSAASPTSRARPRTRWCRNTTFSPMVQIYATPQGRDLGAVAADVKADRSRIPPRTCRRASSVVLLGQVQTMNSAFSGLLFGLLAAVVLIYLLIVVNFQSWSDPFVIITALPAALAGIVWMLFTTQTTLSVPALTGAIMCMGVATANSVLVISFARERYAELGDPVAAALEAGFVRFRPVLMTALAMIIGMAPMALGLGEGGEQNAPLGRAVIGGLIFATTATLMFVPVVFSMVHKKQAAKARRITGDFACPLNKALRSRAGSWASSGSWPSHRRTAGRGHRHPGARGLRAPNCASGPTTRPFRPSRWRCPTPRCSTPRSTCRAGSRPITARRSLPASAAI